jgi:hypothetical protein
MLRRALRAFKQGVIMDVSLNILKFSINDLVLDIVRRELKNEDCSKLRLRMRYVYVSLNALNRLLVKFPDDSERESAIATYAIYLLGNYMRTNDVDSLYADVVQIKAYELPDYSTGGYEFVVRNTETGGIEKVSDIGASFDIINDINQNSANIDNVNNDLNDFKVNKIGVDTELKTNSQVISESINEVVSTMLFPFTDAFSFVYDGTNNQQPLSFAPNSFGAYTRLNGVDLNPFMDFQYDNDSIIIAEELLTINTQYILITQYYKSI